MKLVPMSRLGPDKGIPYSRAHIYRMLKAGSFPKPIRIGANRIAFVEAEIDEWIAARIRQREVAA